jgi:hypothetical protein
MMSGNSRRPPPKPEPEDIVEVGGLPPHMAKAYFDLVQGAEGLGTRGVPGYTGVDSPWSQTEVDTDWELVMSPGGRVLEVLFQGQKVNRVLVADLRSDKEHPVPRLHLEIEGPLAVSVAPDKKRRRTR